MPVIKQQENVGSNPQEEQDIAIIHKLTLTTLQSKALKYHGTPGTIANAPLENLLASPEVIAWMQLRFRDQNGKFDSLGWVQFVISHRGFANKLHAETQSKLHSLFETEGKSLGILQFALEDPITTGHLINVFTDVEIFIKWVNGDFDDK